MMTNIANQPYPANWERTERIISHHGLTFQGLNYASPLLVAVCQMNRASDRTVIHFNRNDLSHVYIFECDGPGFAAIPCEFFRYARGLALVEHRTILSYCRRNGLTPTEEILLQMLWKLRAEGSDRLKRISNNFVSGSASFLSNHPRNIRAESDYSAQMTRLGHEVRNFGSGKDD